MSQELWDKVDRYFEDKLIGRDAALEAALADSEAGGLPPISVTATQGKLLQIFVKMLGASRVLEVGTLGGYSTIWMARALGPGGRLTTLEIDAKHAEVAKKNIARAGVSDRVELRLGPAIETLPKLTGPFDLVFIDADKQSTLAYFEHALRLSRPGSLIVVDNVVRKGEVADSASESDMVKGIQRFCDAFSSISGVTGTAVQTVGSKGYDGVAVMLVG